MQQAYIAGRSSQVASRCSHVHPTSSKRTAVSAAFANTSRRLRRNQLSVVVRSEASSDSAEKNGSPSSLMPMADSLIERAKEVAATGVVDDDFKSTYVTELQAELESLTSRLHQAESSASQLEEAAKSAKDQFVRMSADFDNFRKRTATEKETLTSNAKGDIIGALLPLIDNFELAKEQLKPESEGEKKIAGAYQGLYKQMVELFRGIGLETVPGVGAPFDPELHEAIMREPNEDVPEGTVLEEFRRGFKLGDKLIRASMVKVSYSDAPAAVSEESEESSE